MKTRTRPAVIVAPDIERVRLDMHRRLLTMFCHTRCRRTLCRRRRACQKLAKLDGRVLLKRKTWPREPS